MEHPPFLSRVFNMQMCIVDLQEGQRLGGKLFNRSIPVGASYIGALCCVPHSMTSLEATHGGCFTEKETDTESDLQSSKSYSGGDLHPEGLIGKHPLLRGHLSRDEAKLVVLTLRLISVSP